MDVFLMVRRKKSTIFTDAKETTSVYELKKIVEGIMKVSPQNQQLWREERLMEDNKTLADYNLTSSTARAQSPATVGLALRIDGGEFEQLEVSGLSVPPELPDVMKPQEPIAQEQAA